MPSDHNIKHRDAIGFTGEGRGHSWPECRKVTMWIPDGIHINHALSLFLSLGNLTASWTKMAPGLPNCARPTAIYNRYAIRFPLEARERLWLTGTWLPTWLPSSIPILKFKYNQPLPAPCVAFRSSHLKCKCIRVIWKKLSVKENLW